MVLPMGNERRPKKRVLDYAHNEGQDAFHLLLLSTNHTQSFCVSLLTVCIYVPYTHLWVDQIPNRTDPSWIASSQL